MMKARFAAVVLLASFSTMAWAADGAALYKTKCAMCHGDQGQGKPNMGIKLVGKSDAAVVTTLTKGGGTKAPHIKPMSTITPEQAQAIAAFVKGLK